MYVIYSHHLILIVAFIPVVISTYLCRDLYVHAIVVSSNALYMSCVTIT